MMKTRYKLIGGVIALLLGFVLLGYGIYGSYRISSARQDIDSTAGWIPDNTAKGVFKGGLNRKVDSYQTPVTLLYIGGILFILVGGFFVYQGRKRKGP